MMQQQGSQFLSLRRVLLQDRRIRPSNNSNRKRRSFTTSGSGGDKNNASTNGSSKKCNNNKLPIILHPYSQSLPSPGYDWCTRCEIRSKKFQKKIGKHHDCLDLPKRIPFLRSGICVEAQNYMKKQFYYMILITIGIFGLGTGTPTLFGSNNTTTTTRSSSSGCEEE